MSETDFADAQAAQFAEDAEAEEGEADQVVDGEGEGEGDEDAPARKTDWEKQAHNLKGQAAAERSRRKAADRRASELEARLEKLETARGPERDELDEMIASLRDDDEDPIGDIAGLKKALKAYRARESAALEESTRTSRIERQVENLRTSMSDAETDFALDHPDYHEAAKYYRQQRHDELEDAGYSGARLNAKLADDLFGVVKTALDNGSDPAERVYALAKRRGWSGKASAAERKLDTVRRATEASARPTGRPAGNELSWGDVAKLDGAARDKAWEKLRARERGKKHVG